MNNNKKYNMNTPLFVSLLYLGDDKKISLNKEYKMQTNANFTTPPSGDNSSKMYP